MNMGLFTLILLVTHFAVKEKFRVEFLGWVCVTVSVSVFAAPLSIVVSKIIKEFELKRFGYSRLLLFFCKFKIFKFLKKTTHKHFTFLSFL